MYSTKLWNKQQVAGNAYCTGTSCFVIERKRELFFIDLLVIFCYHSPFLVFHAVGDLYKDPKGNPFREGKKGEKLTVFRVTVWLNIARHHAFFYVI